MVNFIPVFPGYCSCGEPLGQLQKPYEQLIEAGATPLEALKRLKLMKMCCRAAILNPPNQIVTNRNLNRLVDEIGLIKEGSVLERDYASILPLYRNGPPIESKIPIPPLPGLPVV